jgi:hypothetical protein
MEETCFCCGAPVNSGKCDICGYEFSLSQKCPRLLHNGIVCANSRKICREKDNWETCKVLRSNDG